MDGMAQEDLVQLADQLLNDPELRELFKRDPEAAAERAGVTLDEDDRQALQQLGVGDMDDEELVARISRRGSGMRL
jgi:uncharacterized protein YbcC (UPF0753/DUF2309 family)